LASLSIGRHRFEVRGVNASDQAGSAAGRAWKVSESAAPAPPQAAGVAAPAQPESVPEEPTTPQGQPFSIEPQLSALHDLYPGAPAQPLPVSVSNPNPEPIFLTALSLTVATNQSGCDGASSFEVLPAGVSESAPLEVPSGATVDLASEGTMPPAIAMRNLPSSQDACKGAELQLLFNGQAHG
jgi:hypothetical protein